VGFSSGKALGRALIKVKAVTAKEREQSSGREQIRSGDEQTQAIKGGHDKLQCSPRGHLSTQRGAHTVAAIPNNSLPELGLMLSKLLACVVNFYIAVRKLLFE
jgi:hypothetical protein